MFPEWILKLLEGAGIYGAIIFVLLTALIGAIAYIKSLHTKADKIYGYRLTERDTLNKALTDTAKVLADMLEATKDRNDLTEDQADLIAKQAMAFELLKVTVLGQYDNIRDYNTAAANAVSAMAQAIRTLTEIVQENRHVYANYIGDLKTLIAMTGNEVKEAIRLASKAQVDDVRGLLGAELTIVQRRRSSAPQKPVR